VQKQEPIIQELEDNVYLLKEGVKPLVDEEDARDALDEEDRELNRLIRMEEQKLKELRK
jgi:hypothetical protein